MSVPRMDHVAIVVNDLVAAVAFFAELGLEEQGEATVADEVVDRIVGLTGVDCDIAMLKTPDGHGGVELVAFRSPPSPAGDEAAPANVPGLRHLCFEVGGLDGTVERLRAHGGELVGEVATYGGTYRLCYVRGPAGIIVELAEKL